MLLPSLATEALNHKKSYEQDTDECLANQCAVVAAPPLEPVSENGAVVVS